MEIFYTNLFKETNISMYYVISKRFDLLINDWEYIEMRHRKGGEGIKTSRPICFPKNFQFIAYSSQLLFFRVDNSRVTFTTCNLNVVCLFWCSSITFHRSIVRINLFLLMRFCRLRTSEIYWLYLFILNYILHTKVCKI